MDWTDYLSTVVRLVDLHDSGHKPGTASPPPSEDRPGLGTGLWLDIAVKLIEYLHEHDIEANEGWIYLGEFIEEMGKHHGVSEDDVQYVVSYLATPSRICSVVEKDDGPPHAIKTTKETALVERPLHQVADRCRLTQIGRQALQMAKMTSNWLYAKHDAQKLCTAILTEDFGVIITQAAAIAQAVRSFSHEITRLLERPGEQEVWETYTKRANDYIEAISDVGDAVIGASDLFATKDVRVRFEAWQSAQQGDVISAELINETLLEIMQSVTKLRRKFADLITELASQKRTIIGNIRFDKAALWAAFNMPSHDQIQLCLTALGPWEVEAFFPSPLDLYGAMRADIEEDHTNILQFDEESEQELPAAIHRFLTQYKQEILDTLQEGSVSLSAAIAKGWVSLDGAIALTELVGVYAAPDWMGVEGQQIGIAFSPGVLNATLPDGAHLRGDELMMFLTN